MEMEPKVLRLDGCHSSLPPGIGLQTGWR